jgi:hypothetical protein
MYWCWGTCERKTDFMHVCMCATSYVHVWISSFMYPFYIFIPQFMIHVQIHANIRTYPYIFTCTHPNLCVKTNPVHRYTYVLRTQRTGVYVLADKKVQQHMDRQNSKENRYTKSDMRVHWCMRTHYTYDYAFKHKYIVQMPMRIAVLYDLAPHVWIYVCKYMYYGSLDPCSPRMCVYTYVFMYVCVDVRMCICTYVYMYVCVYVRMCICTYVFMYVCVYVRMCITTPQDEAVINRYGFNSEGAEAVHKKLQVHISTLCTCTLYEHA